VVEVPVGEITLDTKDLAVVTIEPDWRIRLLSILTNPNVAYILMIVGIYGIILEFYNPGMFLPGITGAISLLLALYAFQILPVSLAGLGLIALGILLLLAETRAGPAGAGRRRRGPHPRHPPGAGGGGLACSAKESAMNARPAGTGSL
jgi:membrane-bound serine protease (ClpP class)